MPQNTPETVAAPSTDTAPETVAEAPRRMPKLAAALDRAVAALDTLVERATARQHDTLCVEIELDANLLADLEAQRSHMSYSLGTEVPLSCVARRAFVRGLYLRGR